MEGRGEAIGLGGGLETEEGRESHKGGEMG